jgi:HSP20 family molecular chaperone IbpA
MNHSIAISAHALVEAPSCYSIIFNFLGQPASDIKINVDDQKNELTVLAKKETRSFRNGSFWTIGVPSDGILDKISTRFDGGVLEIKIPRGRVNKIKPRLIA